jgi:hypothetical protein
VGSIRFQRDERIPERTEEGILKSLRPMQLKKLGFCM